jgi:hypothetical protein
VTLASEQASGLQYLNGEMFGMKVIGEGFTGIIMLTSVESTYPIACAVQ